MKAFPIARLAGFIIAATLSLIQPGHTAVLTIQQTAQYAFDAGFRGGSLVSAIAAAEAEAAFDTEAVNNNLHETTAGGQLITGTNGRPVLLSLPRTGRQMLPLDSIQAVGNGRFGRVVSHCRGLWQFNNKIHPDVPTDTMAFDPVASAACAWKVSRHGRDWGKWVVMQTGTAWDPARLSRARSAAMAIDFSVMTGNLNQRVQARVTAGSIRMSPAGTRIRALHAGDMGRLLAGPVKAAITQGPQTSVKLWWQVQWDSGPAGWASEDLLIRSSTLGLQPAQPVHGGAPHNITGIKTDPTLTWCTGANTTTQKVYLGRAAALGESDLKFTGLVNDWTPPAPLLPFTSYHWRVDTISAQGAVLPGPVWNFLTRPPEPAVVTLESVSTSPLVPQPGFNFVITCRTQSPSDQPVLVGASLHRYNTVPITDLAYEVPRFVPAGSGSFTRNFNLPLNTPQGTYTMLIRLAQDYNNNGVIDDFETTITEKRLPLSITPPGPLVTGLAVSPATMAPGQQATITATVTALPGSSLTTLKLFRAEGESVPGAYTLVQSRNIGSSTGFDALITDRPPSIRRYWYALQAFDNTGRAAPDGPYFRPVSMRVTVGDNQPPVLAWNAPGDGAVIAPNSNFTGTITDQDIVESAAYRVDDSDWEKLGTSGWFIYSGASAGSHSITIRATDRSGNSVVQSRSYYIAAPPGSADFDEDQLFSGTSDHNPYWQLGRSGGAAITNGRIDAPALGDRAIFTRMKPPPGWAESVEVSFQCGVDGAAVTWDRNFFRPLLARIVPAGTGLWQLQTGDTSNWLSIPLAPFSAGASTRLSVLLRLTGNQFYCRVVHVGATPQLLADSLQTLPNLSPATLQNITFQTGSPAAGPGWLDDISFRALRAGQAFACRQIRPLLFTTSDRSFSVDWSSIPGRLYQLEVLNAATGQWSATGGPTPATGLLTGQNLTFPRTRPSALVRVRQVLP